MEARTSARLCACMCTCVRGVCGHVRVRTQGHTGGAGVVPRCQTRALRRRLGLLLLQADSLMGWRVYMPARAFSPHFYTLQNSKQVVLVSNYTQVKMLVLPWHLHLMHAWRRCPTRIPCGALCPSGQAPTPQLKMRTPPRSLTQALDMLGRMCESNKWATLRLDGSCSVKQRQGLVDRFNDPKDPSYCFLVCVCVCVCVCSGGRLDVSVGGAGAGGGIPLEDT